MNDYQIGIVSNTNMGISVSYLIEVQYRISFCHIVLSLARILIYKSVGDHIAFCGMHLLNIINVIL